MSQSISPETIAAIRALFFERLAQYNRELIEAHNDITQEINVQNHYSILALLVEVEVRFQAMQTILIVFRDCLGG